MLPALNPLLPNTGSRLLPDLDPALIARCMGETSQTQAVRALPRALRDANTSN